MKGWALGVVMVGSVAAGGVGFAMTLGAAPPGVSTASATGPIGLRSQQEPTVRDDIGGLGTQEVDPADIGTTTSTTEPVGPPACTTGDGEVEGDPLDDWATLVVDTAHRLPPDFEPPDLVEVSAAGFSGAGNDQVREIVVLDLASLREAAEANGTPFALVSGYRSYERQQQLFDEQVATQGLDAAAATTARPGHSEHQLGTTIDVLDPASVELTPAFGITPAGVWIAEHAWEHGFVISYPDEAREQTCYDFEPWHIRFVGRDVARQIHESGLTPRQWMLEHR